MSIIALISYVLQVTFLNYIGIYNIKPNLIVITTISYALIRGKEEGAVYGLFSGLLLDILGGKVIGLFALMGMILGLTIGYLNKNLYNENYLVAIALTACGTFVYNLVYFIIWHFGYVQSQFGWYLISYIIPETIYNTAFSIFIYFLILYINKKIDYYKKLTRLY